MALVAALAGGLRWATGSGGAPVLIVFPYAIVGEGGGGAVGPTEAHVAALGEALVVSLTAALEGEAGVVGPDGAAGLRGPDDVEGARASLGACLLLSGSVRFLTPDTLIVFTQIVRASDRVHVWAARDTLLAESAPDVLAGRIVEGAREVVGSC